MVETRHAARSTTHLDTTPLRRLILWTDLTAVLPPLSWSHSHGYETLKEVRTPKMLRGTDP